MQLRLNHLAAALLAASIGATSAASDSHTGHHHHDDDAKRGAPSITEHSEQLLTLPPADQPSPESFSVVVMIDGQPRELVMHRHSLREPGFRLILDTGANHLVDVVAKEPHTYRGVVGGDPGTRVAASLRGDRFTASIHRQLADGSIGETWYVQPVASLKRGGAFQELPDGPATGAKAHVIYRRDAVVSGGHSCGNSRPGWEAPAAAPPQPAEGGIASGDAGIDGYWRATIAFDADWEYYDEHDESVDDVVDELEEELNSVDFIYERDVAICYGIGAIIVRTDEDDPYTSDDATERPCQLRTWWNINADDIPRNLVQMATGVDLSDVNDQGVTTYGVAGVGYIGAVSCLPNLSWPLSCTYYDWLHYSVAEDTSIYSMQITLIAHELGHNWGACHCNVYSEGCSGSMNGLVCGIMEASLDNPGQDWFSTHSKEQIIEWRDWVSSCLVPCGCGSKFYVPSDYSTIQEALGDAHDCGNTVYVESGSYATPTLALPFGGGVTTLIPTGGTVILHH